MKGTSFPKGFFAAKPIRSTLPGLGTEPYNLGSLMSPDPPFVGRGTELARWKKTLVDPRGQVVLVVGQPGMGKSRLLSRMVELARDDRTYRCGSVRYEVTPSDSVATVLELMLEHALDAARVSEGSLAGSAKRLEQWRALLNVLNLGDLVMSLRHDPKRSIREQFIDCLERLAERMPGNGRAIFVIDPEKYLQPRSDQDWMLVANRLPERIKLLFAQRPDDVLADSLLFRGLSAEGRLILIPEGQLEVLDHEAVRELVAQAARGSDHSSAELESAVKRYGRHPYAVSAALALVQTGISPEDLPSDPTPEALSAQQWQHVCRGGSNGRLGHEAIKLFEAYAVLEVPADDKLAKVVSKLSSTKIKRILADRYIGSLVRREDDLTRLYHSILADHIRAQLSVADASVYHERAIREFRRQLAHALATQSRQPRQAAERLPEHLLAKEGPSAFAAAVLEECIPPLLNLGLLDVVFALSDRALAIVPSGSESEGLLLNDKGLVCRTRGDLARAEELLEGALKVLEPLGIQRGIGIASSNLSLVCADKNDLDRAEVLCRKARDIFQRLKLRRRYANECDNLAYLRGRRGDPEGAGQNHQTALSIYENLGDRLGVAQASSGLGRLHRTRGDLADAEQAFRRALAIFEDMNHQLGVANVSTDLGLILTERGDRDQAEQMHLKALAAEDVLGRDVYSVVDCRELARIYVERGELEHAEAMYRKLAAAEERSGKEHAAACTRVSLAGVLCLRGKADEAETVARRTLAVLEEARLWSPIGVACWNLASVLERRGDLVGAHSFLLRAREAFEQSGLSDKLKETDDRLARLQAPE